MVIRKNINLFSLVFLLPDLLLLLLLLLCCDGAVPNPPLNISLKVVHLNGKELRGSLLRESLSEGGGGSQQHQLQRQVQDSSRRRKARDVRLMEDKVQPEAESQEEAQEEEEEAQRPAEAMGASATLRPAIRSLNASTPADHMDDYPNMNMNGNTDGATDGRVVNTNGNESSEADTVTQFYWPEPTGSPSPTEEEFVNAVVPEYEDSNEPGSAMDLPTEMYITPTPLPPILLELRWLPPRPPITFDGFNIYIFRDGASLKSLLYSPSPQL